MRLKGRLQLDQAWYSAMKRAPTMVQKELRKALRTGASAVRNRVPPNAPRGPGGRHKERLAAKFKIRLKRLVAWVYSSLWYSRVQEEGTGYLPGGAIKPKRKKSLHFKIGDKWIHLAPGRTVKYEGHGYLQKSLEQSEGDLQKAIDDAGRRVAKSIFGGG